MAIADDLPLSESFGVFVGVAGLDWLADGQAEPLKAIALAFATGVIIMAIRQWRKRQRKN
jgi:hypothetical protein